jgi:L-alanine-DL-glutamate epimerase-like enolase superfamily enzyme
MVKDLEIDANGLMHAPTEPGLGGEIDFELITRKTEAVLR